MERMAWTDERMDDFAVHTYRRFDEMDSRLDRVDADIRALRVETKTELVGLRSEMTARFERVEARIDDVNRTMLRLGSGAIVTFVVGFAGLIATQL